MPTPHPATGDAVSAPSESGAPATTPRYHDLDALRAFAMLAGIAFHAAVPFIPYWTPNGPGAELLGGIFVGIHGFRMPLFFLLSGFFTTMLWQRAGTRGLLRHRLKRVGLPLALAIVVILPLVTLGLLGGMVLAGNPAVEPDPTPQPAFRLAHLWFLWMLLLLVGAFAVVVTLARRLPSPDSRIHRVLSSRPGWAAVLLVIAVLAQSRMTNGLVGPDTSEGLIPVPRVLVYYACFFAWGALVFGHSTRHGIPLIRAMGRWWPATLAAGAAVFVLLTSGPLSHPLATVLNIAYAVLLTCALLGVAHRFFASDNPAIRWVSDSSYWLYLTHLPLVLVAEGLALRWHIHPLIAFPVIVVSVSGLLLLTYRYGVRYTRIGTLLNGPRTRAVSATS